MAAKLLVLGGGAFSLPIVRWAAEAGLEVVVVDPDARAPARRAAHAFHAIPLEDVEGHAALARRLSRDEGRSGPLAGLLASDARTLPLLAPLAAAVPGLLPPRAALERAFAPEEARTFLSARGFPVAAPGRAEGELDLFAFFRDGAFVPGASARRRTLAGGDELSLQPSGLDPEALRAAQVLVERGARALGLEHGPVQATLVEDGAHLALAAFVPAFTDTLGATHVARLVHGRSPVQAWCAHLAGAGGPFDEVAAETLGWAGWRALLPDRAGLFAGVDGLARARTRPGVVDLWFEEPGRELDPTTGRGRALGYVWATGFDAAEVEERLGAARAALDVRVARPQRVA